jgi:hypothetical protein
MWHGLTAAPVPDRASPRACRRSWLLGFAAAVIARVRSAEEAARAQSEQSAPAGQPSRTALVFADRSLVIRRAVDQEYPATRKARVTCTGSGYGAGYDKGQRADIGTSRVGATDQPALGSDSR